MHFQPRPSIFNHHLATITLLTKIKHHLATTQAIEATIGMFYANRLVRFKGNDLPSEMFEFDPWTWCFRLESE
ncbi:hypothetical protein Hanom_Chr12g01138551 [Helianthus anomalus]